MEEVFSEAVMNFKKRFDDVKVSVSVPDEVLLVPMDAMLIEQVIFNLMDNARTHGRSTMEIRLYARLEGADVAIGVEDNGVGIDPETMPHSGKGAVDTTRCMGIGLSVCRSIVEAHGGRIHAENLPSGGARVEFTLPLENKGV